MCMTPSVCGDSVREPDAARLRHSPGGLAQTVILTLLAAILAVESATAEGQDGPPDSELRATELKKLSVEELMSLEVTSVSKRSERLLDAPASIFVIAADDIRRSGVTTLAEALRLAPNLNVARLDSVQYAVSARGFNNAIGNKLLVLIDGRTVYTPLFSGVFWDQQDVMLEDVDRIEVISGPGATLWGANAVNGVINVSTRPASETQGPLLVGGTGDTEWGAAVRYGGTLGSAASFRLYGKFSEWDHTQNAAGAALANDWQRGQVGFRADWSAANDVFTLQGDAYSGQSQHRGVVGPFEITPVEVSGLNVLTRWNRQLASGGDFQVQAYFDHAKRDDIVLFRPDADIVDIELQHAIPLGAQRILWGAGYRRARDEVDPGLLFGFIPSGRTLEWENLFIQDEFPLSENVGMTLGIKLENNDYSGWEYLPGARVAWKVAENRLVWTALSRAVRAPSRLDREIFLPPTPPFFVAGGPDFESEVANVLEFGYRAQPSNTASYSITAFVHDWDKVRSGTALPVIIENKIEGTVYGAEIWGSYQPTSYWVLNAGFTWLEEDLRLQSDSTDPVGIDNPNLRNDPDYWWLLRSTFDLASNVELDLDLRGVDSLPNPSVPGYTELDVRLAWLPLSNLELSIVGRNLLHDSHPEFGALPGRSEIERSIFGQVRCRF